MTQHYDIIGDIHGHADILVTLLNKLGYQLNEGVYRHKKHKVIFLGDFIDRGPQQREVIDIVKPMIEQGTALSVMGNHEFNAICYASHGASGQLLRKHSEKNTKQHQAFLDAYPEASERKQIINWFKTLPLFIETNGIRVIHASWNEPSREILKPLLDEKQCLLSNAYDICSQKGSAPYLAVETILKGPEADLPEGVSFKDKDGNVRKNARIKWWASKHLDKKERLHLGDNITDEHNISETEIDTSYHYSDDLPPVFVGHYWLNDETPIPLSENCACLDYSIAKDGKLVAYLWRGERILKESNFDWCEA